ncbi:MAG TPA: hypothetical protein PLA54_10155 [Spirochaetota bacterium]|nr:hypothetical protein [Spirochaetota bacterium]
MRKIKRFIMLVLVIYLGYSAYRGSFFVSSGYIGILELKKSRDLFLPGFHFSTQAAFSGDFVFRKLPLSGRTVCEFSAPLPTLERLDDNYLKIRSIASFSYSLDISAFSFNVESEPQKIAEAEFIRSASMILKKISYENFSSSFSSDKFLSVWKDHNASISEDISSVMKGRGIIISSIEIGSPVFPSDERYAEVSRYAAEIEKTELFTAVSREREASERNMTEYRLKKFSDELDIISSRIKDNPSLLKYLIFKNFSSGVNPALYDLNSAGFIDSLLAEESKAVSGQKNDARKDIDNFK